MTNSQIIQIIERAATTASHEQTKNGLQSIIAALKTGNSDEIFRASQDVYEAVKREVPATSDLHRIWIGISGCDLFGDTDSLYGQNRLTMYMAKAGL